MLLSATLHPPILARLLHRLAGPPVQANPRGSPFGSKHWLRIFAGIFCFVVFVLPAAQGEDTAAVEGRVQLPTPAPSATGAGARYGISPSGQAVGAPDAPVAVIFLEGDFPRRAPPGAPAQVGQRHTQFAPGVLAVQVGTAVEFPNFDDFYHNVFSYSKPKHFDLGRYRKDEKPAVQVFDKPGLITLRCEIHETMRGTILVLDTPYFVKSDATGHYRLDGLPTGKYVLKAWVNEKTTLEHPVDLQARNVAHVSFP